MASGWQRQKREKILQNSEERISSIIGIIKDSWREVWTSQYSGYSQESIRSFSLNFKKSAQKELQEDPCGDENCLNNDITCQVSNRECEGTHCFQKRVQNLENFARDTKVELNAYVLKLRRNFKMMEDTNVELNANMLEMRRNVKTLEESLALELSMMRETLENLRGYKQEAVNEKMM